MAGFVARFFTEINLIWLILLFQVMYMSVPESQEHVRQIRYVQPIDLSNNGSTLRYALKYRHYGVISITRCGEGNLVSIGVLNWVFVMDKNPSHQPPQRFC